MNIFTNFSFKILIFFLSLGNAFSFPIKNDIIDSGIPLLPERPHFQLERTVFIIPGKNK